jgi:hypothetical protein
MLIIALPIHSFCVQRIMYLPKSLQALRERLEPQEKSSEVSYHSDYYVCVHDI